MKKHLLLITGCLVALSLTACSGSEVNADWNGAKKAKLIVPYVEQNQEKMNMEQLKKTAGSDDSPLSQQFKATVLLCALEYAQSQNSKSQDLNSVYRFDYPVSSHYADRFLAKADLDADKFWKALDSAFPPYESFDLLLAASDNLDGKTLEKIYKAAPKNGDVYRGMKAAIDKWVKEKPVVLVKYGDHLNKAGFFNGWNDKYFKIGTTLFPSYRFDGDPIYAKDADQAIQYVNYLRGSFLSRLSPSNIMPSSMNGDDTCLTGLAVAVGQPLSLNKQTDEALPETIDTDEKKVAAFFCNKQADEFPNSPTTLLLGDFLLNLPEDQAPESAADTDYYLILTPNYQYGDTYTAEGTSTRTGESASAEVQKINCDTSIDLYDAKTGAFLRHLCDVTEHLYKDPVKTKDGTYVQYPRITPADVLCYIYQNINTPDIYQTAMERAAGLKEYLKAGQTVTLGNWEITYQSSRIAKSFGDDYQRFAADDGSKFVIAKFTVKNIGKKRASIFPSVYNDQKDTSIVITNSDLTKFYYCTMPIAYKQCLNDKSLTPGQSADGELFFQVDDDALSSADLYFKISLGNQRVYYPLAK